MSKDLGSDEALVAELRDMSLVIEKDEEEYHERTVVALMRRAADALASRGTTPPPPRPQICEALVDENDDDSYCIRPEHHKGEHKPSPRRETTPDAPLDKTIRAAIWDALPDPKTRTDAWTDGVLENITQAVLTALERTTPKDNPKPCPVCGAEWWTCYHSRSPIG